MATVRDWASREKAEGIGVGVEAAGDRLAGDGSAGWKDMLFYVEAGIQ